MTTYFDTLIGRSLQSIPTVQPRLLSRFESAATIPGDAVTNAIDGQSSASAFNDAAVSPDTIQQIKPNTAPKRLAFDDSAIGTDTTQRIKPKNAPQQLEFDDSAIGTDTTQQIKPNNAPHQSVLPPTMPQSEPQVSRPPVPQNIEAETRHTLLDSTASKYEQPLNVPQSPTRQMVQPHPEYLADGDRYSRQDLDLQWIKTQIQHLLNASPSSDNSVINASAKPDTSRLVLPSDEEARRSFSKPLWNNEQQPIIRPNQTIPGVAPSQPATPPEIKISIGRIEIRADVAAERTNQPKNRVVGSVVTLEEYLRQSKKGQS